MSLDISNRKPNLMDFKSLDLKVLDIDEGSRRVKFYMNTFGNIDSDRDRSFKGAFLKSILERGPKSTGNRKIAFLRMHDWNKQIGKYEELLEDDYGLLCVGFCGRSSQGQDALYDYQDGIIREHSFGFKYVSDKMVFNEKENCYDITEYELWEGGPVTFGASSETMVIDVAKGLTKQIYLDQLNNEMSILLKALKEGHGTDERLYGIELGLNVIQSKYNKLVTYEPQELKSRTLDKGTQEPGNVLTPEEKLLADQNNQKKLILLNQNF